MRPLGLAALEDKIVQQAARTVLECIYEQEFLGFSYGYRPGRGSHQALDDITAVCQCVLTLRVKPFLQQPQYPFVGDPMLHKL